MAEINVTPFVDVMLVLLIIFMVAAPLLTVGVPVELPKTAAKALPTEQEEPLTVTLDGGRQGLLMQTTEVAAGPAGRRAAGDRGRAQRATRSTCAPTARFPMTRVVQVMGALNAGGLPQHRAGHRYRRADA